MKALTSFVEIPPVSVPEASEVPNNFVDRSTLKTGSFQTCKFVAPFSFSSPSATPVGRDILPGGRLWLVRDAESVTSDVVFRSLQGRQEVDQTGAPSVERSPIGPESSAKN